MCPRDAITLLSAVAQSRLRPPDDRGTRRGTLCFPPGQFSITISQAVMSLAWTMRRRRTAVHHGRSPVIFSALSNAAAAVASPSMVTSWNSNCPGRSFATTRPMCIGRSRYLLARASASDLRTGPTSTVKKVTIAADVIDVTRASRYRGSRRARKRRVFLDDALSDASLDDALSDASFGGSGEVCSCSIAVGVHLLHHHQDAPGFDRRAGGDAHGLHASFLGRAQLVFHLHSFYDDD